MSNLYDFLAGVLDVALQIFGISLDAFQKYPMATFLSFAAVYIFLRRKSLVARLWFLPKSGEDHDPFDDREDVEFLSVKNMAFLLVGCAAAIVLTYITGIVLAFVAHVAVAGASVQPFASRPLPYVVCFVAMAPIGLVLALQQASWTWRKVDPLHVIALAYLALMLTYILAAIYMVLTRDSPLP
ncbi:MAG: hypothetical protein KL863_05560 [Rhizobium sp.]|nr:hypothetical protein [Rhizobium sp.]